jgi:hypothetical protein
VHHLFVCLRDARGALRVDLDELGLTAKVYSVCGCVLLCDGDELCVGASCPDDSWRTFKRRKASARIPACSSLKLEKGSVGLCLFSEIVCWFS